MESTIIEERFNSYKERIEKLENKVEILDARMDKFDSYMEKIDVTLGFMSDKISSVDRSLSDFIRKYERAEEKRQTERDKHIRQSSKDLKEVTMAVLKYLGVVISAAVAALFGKNFF